MPTLAEHIQKATGNETVADLLNATTQAQIDWKLIMLFYAAMHYVEAYLAKSLVHLRSHTTRDGYVTRESKLKSIRNEYNHLKFYGYNARYEMDTFTAQDVADAKKYFTALKAFLLPLL